MQLASDEQARRQEATIVDWTSALDGHAEQIVGAVFAEYGFAFHPENYDSDLRRIQEIYLEKGGIFRFLVVDGRPVATVAAKPLTAEECELKRLYLLREYRGQGFGGRMMDEVLDWARDRGYRTVVAWSDTRFTDAHAVYKSRGFEQFAVRPEPGPDPAEEYGFRLDLQSP
jgi:putative acetyltransferase